MAVDHGFRILSRPRGYFAGTLPGLDAGYLRPRYDGALLVQNKGRDVLWEFLGTGGEPNEVLDTIDALYRRSRHAGIR